MKTLLLLLLPASVFAWNSQSFDGWILGPNEPEVNSNRLLHDGASGSSIYVPVGTSPFYYEAIEDGEGSVEFWVYDPAKCLADPNPGYPSAGPMWGLKTGQGDVVCVGIGRPSYVAGCQGYSPWSTVAPYSYYWFGGNITGVRGSNDVSFSPGWRHWIVTGTYDDISFEALNLYHEPVSGPPYEWPLDSWYMKQIYNDTYMEGSWEAVFGTGWNAFYLRGDGNGGVEDISIDIVSGTGIFAGVNSISSAQGYQDAGWDDIKQLFR